MLLHCTYCLLIEMEIKYDDDDDDDDDDDKLDLYVNLCRMLIDDR